ncbi:MAG: phosphate ABC transporter, permease protein PstA, partial [Clostridia bacterium]
LAVALYKLAGEGLHINEAYATACVLIIIVLILNTLSEFVVKKLQKKQLGEN